MSAGKQRIIHEKADRQKHLQTIPQNIQLRTYGCPLKPLLFDFLAQRESLVLGILGYQTPSDGDEKRRQPATRDESQPAGIASMDECHPRHARTGCRAIAVCTFSPRAHIQARMRAHTHIIVTSALLSTGLIADVTLLPNHRYSPEELLLNQQLVLYSTPASCSTSAVLLQA